MTTTTTKTPSAPIELGHLGCGEWEQRLEQLARDADDAGPDAPLQARLDLAMAAFSMLWLGFSPPLIARSARASIALREPVVVADPGQLDTALLSSRAARREGLKHLEDLPRPGAELSPVMLDDDDDDEDQGAAAVAAPKPKRRRLRPVPAGVVPDGWISVEGLADRLDLTRGAVQRWAREGLIPENLMVHWRGRWWFDPAVEPPKRQPRTPRPAPDGWVHGAAACSLLGIDRAQLARWRREGVIPAAGCQPHGRGYVFDGDVVEAMLKRLQPAPKPTVPEVPPSWNRPQLSAK